MTKLIKLFTILIALSSAAMADELPSWGMTETQYKMPNFTTKMKKIGERAVNNDWLLKITAPKDWHSKIRSALSEQGAKNVQINFKDSLYKSITITAAPGMALKSTNGQQSQPGVVKKQVVIEKPSMDTEIDAPEFNDEFKTDDILSDIGDIELALPTNGQSKDEKSRARQNSSQKIGETEKNLAQKKVLAEKGDANHGTSKQDLKEGLRLRYARGKSVDKSISYANITDDDDLYVAEDVVLVKRFVNRGVAIYYWMREAYNPVEHALVEKGSGKYVKSEQASKPSAEPQESTQAARQEQKPVGKLFDFVAVTDNQGDQDDLRQRHIRNKAVNSTIKASQLKPKDVLYVMNQTVLVERPLGNSRSAYFWLKGDTDSQRTIEAKGPQQFVIQ